MGIEPTINHSTRYMIRMDQKIVDKFWASVEKQENGCWVWTKISNFYHQANGAILRISPHRLSYEISFGALSNDMLVYQTCGNLSCVKPDHLVLKSKSERSKTIKRSAPPDYIQKFQSSVEKTNFCWNWKGFLDKSGLPVIRMANGIKNGKQSLKEYSPRRISLQLAGKELDPESHAIPWCRNKLCVNPDHLAHGNEARFWAKVHKGKDDECWPWIGAHDKDMYGKFRIVENGKGIDIRAHTYSWELHNKHKVRTDIGMMIMHSCDHPWCVNPYHLSVGTNTENTRDRHEKGRDARGESQWCAKLTEEKVREARKLHKDGMSNIELSRLYGVSQSNMSAILRNETWRHVV